MELMTEVDAYIKGALLARLGEERIPLPWSLPDVGTQGDPWGAAADESRRSALSAKLRSWWAETDHATRAGPFVGERLTGADVYWLAIYAQAHAGLNGDTNAAQQLLAIANEHRVYSIAVDLSLLQLQGADLGGAQLRGAVLRGAHLEKAKLRSADLEGADLTDAHLDGTDLNGARLNRTFLSGAHLKSASLNWACLEEASLGGADLEKALLNGALLCGADLVGCRLRGALLVGAVLERANLGAARLEGAHLEDASLQEASLARAWLDNATNLSGAVLTDAQLEGVHFDGTDLTGVDWKLVSRLGEEKSAHERRERDSAEKKNRYARFMDYRAATRAYRQLAIALEASGMAEDAARFAYRARVMQRSVYWFEGWRSRGRYVTSWLLDALAGYGYRPGRSVGWYVAVIVGFAYGYFGASHGTLTFGIHHSQIQPLRWYEALVLSISSFHGRGFFQPVQSLGDPVAILAAVEAVIGLLIELCFIATFTQRSFGSK